MRTDVRREDRNGHKTRNARKVRNVNALQDQNPDRKDTQIKRNRKIMKSLLRNSLFCLLGICLMAACNENTVYHSYQSLPDEGWGKSDTLSFLIPVTDSIPPTLRLFAEVRNRTDYPYHNLHLFISQNLQDSTVWRTDTITINRLIPREGGSEMVGEVSINQRSLSNPYVLCILLITPSKL